MSEQEESPEERPQRGSHAEEPQQADASGKETDQHDKEVPERSRSVVAWLALILALAAAGLSGWQAWLVFGDDRSTQIGSELDDQRGAIESVRQRLGDISERLGQVESRLDDLSGRLDSGGFDPAPLREELSAQAGVDDQLRQRVSTLSDRLDQAVSDLESRLEQVGAVRSDRMEDALADARFRLALVEVAGLLRLGQARAELAGDPAGAAAAYRQARSRLQQLDDGRLERLAQLVGRELESLRGIETTDWAGLAGRLSGLEDEAAQWPLAVGASPAAESGPTGEAPAGEDGWLSGIRKSLGGLVRVTPRESAPLTPAAADSVRERLRLHLASSQAAVARRNVDELASRIERAATLIRSHFDTSVESVSSALETLEEAAAVGSSPLPDLGSALAEAERRLAAP